jgi:hypothetical protein
MFLKAVIFLAIVAVSCSTRVLPYHAVYVQHFDQDMMQYNNGNALSIITNTLQHEVSILNENHVYAHELIAALSAVCTSHVKSMTNVKDTVYPIDTHIFTYDEEAAALLPFVRITQPKEVTTVNGQSAKRKNIDKRAGKKKPTAQAQTQAQTQKEPVRQVTDDIDDVDEVFDMYYAE